MKIERTKEKFSPAASFHNYGINYFIPMVKEVLGDIVQENFFPLFYISPVCFHFTIKEPLCFPKYLLFWKFRFSVFCHIFGRNKKKKNHICKLIQN